jgi:hypothetical protein
MARQAPKMHILVSSSRTTRLVFDHPLLQGMVSPLSQRSAARPACCKSMTPEHFEGWQGF